MKVILGILVISALVLGITMTNSASGKPELQVPEGRQVWTSVLGTILIMFSFLPQMICIPTFATRPLTYEKASGVVMSLLATEITPRQIWTGKGAAIFVPGCIGSYLGMLILLPFFNCIVPLPWTLYVCAFLIMPLAMFLMAMITVQLSMLKSVDLAIAPSYVVGFLLMALFPAGAMTGLFAPGTIVFTLVCIGILAIALAVEQVLASRMTVEKVVLA